MKYDTNYFIKKFESIPEDEIGKGGLNNHCAIYHCGNEDYPKLNEINEETKGILEVFDGTVILGKHFKNIFYVNDGLGDFRGYADTPKQRILKRLNEIKASQK